MLDSLAAWLREYQPELERRDRLGNCVVLIMTRRKAKRYQAAQADLFASLLGNRDGPTVLSFFDHWTKVPRTNESWIVPGDADLAKTLKGLNTGKWLLHHFRSQALLKPWSPPTDPMFSLFPECTRAFCESMVVHGIDVVVVPLFDNYSFDLYIDDAEVASAVHEIRPVTRTPPPRAFEWLRNWLRSWWRR